VLPQSRRHLFIATLRESGIVVTVNKMDLMDFSEEVFKQVRADFWFRRAIAHRGPDVRAISARGR
jgi:sulfate adenylyltransferase subunit 1 (EFTu-like GTPase family)